MDKKRRTSIVGGSLLILVGGLLFAAQVFPDFMPDFWEIISWPWFIIGIGLFLFALGAAIGEPGLAVPATIVGGIGGILAYQWFTGNFESWSYLWALIPGFVGVHQFYFTGHLWLLLRSNWFGRTILACAFDRPGCGPDG